MSSKLLPMVLALTLIPVTAQAQELVTDGLVAAYTLDKADIVGPFSPY